ncbi:MAG: ABC transporter permease [Verrucomicrobiota bacterium]
MPWYLYHALKQLFPSGRFFSFFSFVSIVGVMLGVCVLIIVQSVMNGFGEGIRQRLVKTEGDIRIRSSEVILDWEVYFDRLEGQENVLAVSPFAEGVIMLQHQNRPQFPIIRGIDPLTGEDVVPMEQFITVGDLDDFDDEGVFLGEGLAYALKAGPGSIVEVFTPLMLERLKEDEVLLPREFKVVGLFRTGSPQVDGNTMISTLRVMQELYGLEDGVHGLVLRLRPGVDAFQYSEELEGGLLRPGLRAVSWLESNRDFLFVVEQEKRVISFILIFIILVASFSIAIALMMAVIRKTREIGLLVAMGARPRQVALSFCFQGFVIGALGTLLGIAMAVLCLHFRRPILTGYSKLTQSEVNFLGVYDVYEIPVHYLSSDFVTVTCFAIGVSTLAGLLPAFRAARLKPADALRSE